MLHEEMRVTLTLGRAAGAGAICREEMYDKGCARYTGV